MKYTLTTTRQGKYTFYGIKSESITINDISTNKQAVLELCSNLEKGGVTDVTLMDIIEDFME